MTSIYLWTVVTIVGVLLLLTAERSGSLTRRTVFKIVASTGFILTALACGSLQSRYGQALLAGLVLSWFGDVFLLSRSAGLFQAGLVSFLLAHVAYGGAFLVLGISLWAALAGAVILTIVVAIVAWRLIPHVPTEMRAPVIAYIVVISLMVALAAGAAAGSGRWIILAGAVTFYCSDLAVARDRFVAPGFLNSLWGLPLYYAAQLLLAHSTAFSQ